MGKGSKDTTRLVTSHTPDKSSPKGLPRLEHRSRDINQNQHQQAHHSSSGVYIPPGVPECDVILKGSTRFWYIEPALFLFGVAGMLISAVLLLRHYFN